MHLVSKWEKRAICAVISKTVFTVVAWGMERAACFNLVLCILVNISSSRFVIQQAAGAARRYANRVLQAATGCTDKLTQADKMAQANGNWSSLTRQFDVSNMVWAAKGRGVPICDNTCMGKVKVSSTPCGPNGDQCPE